MEVNLLSVMLELGLGLGLGSLIRRNFFYINNNNPPQARPPTPSSLTLTIIAFGVSLDTTLQLISKAT